MTQQAPEKFINEYPGIAFDGYNLYSLIGAHLPAEPSNNEKVVSTALYRGYVATFKLTKDGFLYLIKFEYPQLKCQKEEQVNLPVSGNFQLDLRESFFGSRIKVPFIDGRLIADESEWIIEERDGRSPVEKLIYESEHNKPI